MLHTLETLFHVLTTQHTAGCVCRRTKYAVCLFGSNRSCLIAGGLHWCTTVTLTRLMRVLQVPRGCCIQLLWGLMWVLQVHAACDFAGIQRHAAWNQRCRNQGGAQPVGQADITLHPRDLYSEGLSWSAPLCPFDMLRGSHVGSGASHCCLTRERSMDHSIALHCPNVVCLRDCRPQHCPLLRS